MTGLLNTTDRKLRNTLNNYYKNGLKQPFCKSGALCFYDNDVLKIPAFIKPKNVSTKHNKT